MNLIIKTATEADLKKIAQCHQAAFSGSLTAKLGINFIASMLRWYLSGANKFLYWMEEDGKCIGYCGGYVMDGSDIYGASSGMSQFGFNSAIKAMLLRPWLFFHPEVLSKYQFIWTNVKRRIRKIIGQQPTKQAATKAQMLNKNEKLQAGLVVIGVLPSLHKKGIGSLLIKEFEERVQKMGATFLSLSVRKKNEKGIAAYRRNGWEIETDEGPSYIMTKTLSL